MLIPRLATAIVLLAACVSALVWLPNVWWTVLLLPVLTAAGQEWGRLAGLTNAGSWRFAIVVTALAAGFWLISVQAGGAATGIYIAGCVFWLFVAVPWLVRGWRVRSSLLMSATGIAVLVPAWLALVLLQTRSWQLLAVLGIIWIADTAAYASGRAWGRHKLAPDISPGKTWEGAAGAAVAVAVYYLVLRSAVPEWGWWDGLVGPLLFVGVAVMSVVGDLFESAVKRQAGVKDSGTLLPGHGGILDRIDSITATLPLAALLVPYAG